MFYVPYNFTLLTFFFFFVCLCRRLFAKNLERHPLLIEIEENLTDSRQDITIIGQILRRNIITCILLGIQQSVCIVALLVSTCAGACVCVVLVSFAFDLRFHVSIQIIILLLCGNAFNALRLHVKTIEPRKTSPAHERMLYLSNVNADERSKAN
jgi:hypothetical protein